MKVTDLRHGDVIRFPGSVYNYDVRYRVEGVTSDGWLSISVRIPHRPADVCTYHLAPDVVQQLGFEVVQPAGQQPLP